jgi:hypothetical protein
MLQHGRSVWATRSVGEPVLAVESRRVAAAWTCGCVALGPNFEGLTWIGCDAHVDALDDRLALMRSCAGSS